MLDRSRQLDVDKLQAVIHDKKTSREERERAEHAIGVIQHQAKDPFIRDLRNNLTDAMINGDRKKSEEIARISKEIDKRYTN